MEHTKAKLGVREMWPWRRGWWCPRHPWPPAWARPYPTYSRDEEIRYLEELKTELEREIEEISRRIEELKGVKEKKE